MAVVMPACQNKRAHDCSCGFCTCNVFPPPTDVPEGYRNIMPFSILVEEVALEESLMTDLDSLFFSHLTDYQVLAQTADSCCRFITIHSVETADGYTITCELDNHLTKTAKAAFIYKGYYCLVTGKFPQPVIRLNKKQTIRSLKEHLMDEPQAYAEIQYPDHQPSAQLVHSHFPD